MIFLLYGLAIIALAIGTATVYMAGIKAFPVDTTTPSENR